MAYVTSFNSFAEACKQNGMTEAEMLTQLKRHLENMNYRSDYNERKNKLNTLLRNDPVVKQRAAELLKKQAK